MMDTYLDDRYVTYMQTGLKVIRHVQMVQNHNVFLELQAKDMKTKYGMTEFRICDLLNCLLSS